MSNVNVGGVEGSLVLNIREWTQPAKDALSAVKDLGTGAGAALSSLATSTSSAASSMGSSLKVAGGGLTSFALSAQKVANTVKADFGKMTADVNASMQNIRSTCQDVGQAMASFSAGLRDSVRAVVSDFATFQKEMHDVDAIAKLSGAELDKLQKSVRAMSGEMKLTQGPIALAAALKDITGAGFDAADGMKVLRAAAKGADAGETDTKTFATGLTPTLRAYGLGADSSSLVSDQMFKAMDQGKIDAGEMARSIGSVAPLAGAAGVSLQEMMGSLASMSLNGKTVSENFNGYRNLLLHLVSPAADAKALLKAYGVEAGETAIRTKGLMGVVKDLYTKTGGNKDALKKILDDEGMQATTALMKLDKGKTTDQSIKAQYGADGATQDAFDRRSKSLLFQLDQVKAAFENFFIGVGSGLEPILQPTAEMLNKIGTYLVKLPDGTKAAIGGFMGMAAAVTTVLAGLTLLAPTFIQIGTWMAGFGGVAKVAAAASGLFSTGVAGIASAVTAAAAPVAALVAAVAILYTAWQNDWGGIRELTASVLSDVQGYAKSAATAMQENFGPALAEISADFKAAWPDIRDFFLYLGKAYFEVAIPAVKAFWEASKASWAAISEAVRLAWGVIGPIIKFIGQEFKDQCVIVATAISGDWKGAMDQWVAHFMNVGPRLLAALQEIASNVMTGMANLGEKVKQAFKDAFTFESTASDTASVDGPLSRGIDFLKGKYGELSDAAQKAAFDVSRPFRMPHANWPALGGAQYTAGSALATGPSSADRIGGGMEGFDPGVEPPKTPKKSTKLTRAQMLSYIRENAGGVEGDITRLTDEALKATMHLVQNSVAARYPVLISSGYRPGSKGYHGSGQAVDVVTPDQPVGNWENTQRPDMIQALAAGTGFRSGLNEFRRDTASHTGATDAHVHLTTGLERQPGLQGGLPGAFLLKGGSSGGMGSVVAALEANQKELLAAQKLVSKYISTSANAFDVKIRDLRTEYDKVMSAAKLEGADPATLNKITAEFKRRVQDVNDTELRETRKTSQELVIMKLEAEGKMGEAAKVRILGTAEDEKLKMQELLKKYPAMAQQINETMASLDQGVSRQLASQSMATTTGRVEDTRAVSSFQGNDPGAAGLIQMFPQFRTDVEAAYAAIQAYIKDPSEATRARFVESKQLIESLSGAAQEQQQKRLAEIDFERQMGTITKEEAIQRQADILNNWVGGEDQKRQMTLGMIETYRTNFETQLGMQGEFNMESLQQFVESLTELDSLTMAQQAQLAAANQIIQQQRITDQQGWQAILQQTETSFQTFLASVMSGQQTFGEAFKALWKNISQMVIQELSKMIAKALVLFAIQKILGIFSGGASELGGALAGAGMSDFGFGLGHSGGLVQHGNIMPTFHSGGWVGGGPLRSDETMAVLQTGEYVLSRQQLANAQSGGGSQAGGSTTVNAPITMTNYINSELDIDRVANQLGRKMSQVLQGAY